MVWLYPHKFAEPDEAILLDDTPETWAALFDDPKVVFDNAGKLAAKALCGARYCEGATSRDKENIDTVTCLVLDVDVEGKVPSFEAVCAALEGIRAIVVTTASHTDADPRLRVLLFLSSSLTPKKVRSLVAWLSANMFPGYEGCIDVDSTGDPGRLGFVGTTFHPEHYRWASLPGELFSWSGIPLEDELWLSAPLVGLDRSPGWTDRATALQFALKAFSSIGYDGVQNGKHRKIILFEAAMALWWAWAAEDDEFVMAVLRHINSQFPEAKDEDVLFQKMKEAHRRTIGDKRKYQTNGPYGRRREPSNAASIASIKHHAKRLRRSTKPVKARLGDELGRMIGQLTVADDQETWRNAIGRCAIELGQTFLDDKPRKLSTFFEPSLKTMLNAAKEGIVVPTLEEIESWITTALEGEKKRKAEQSARAEDSARRNIEFATCGQRDTKYTKQEIDTWQSPNGVGLNDKTWIVVSGKGYFPFLDGTWPGPYTETEFDAQGYTDLEAASDFVRLKTFNEEGVLTYVPLKDLLRKYGSRCITRVDFTCERTWYRIEDHTLMLVGPIRNPLEPKFHTDVDEWFRVMTGRKTPANEKIRREEAAVDHGSTDDDYDVLCNWLACLTQLEHICAALYLQGPKSVGKGLFADGVARLWKGGKIPLTAAFGHFNSLLTESPLIHVDEGLPPHMSASVLLRRTLAEREHVYTRKGIDSGKVSGCVRMLFTANNLDIFNADSEEKFKEDDTEALGDRFVHITVRPESAAHLRNLGQKHHDFVNKNMIAEHTMWLNEKRWASIKRVDLRFLIEGRNRNVSNVVATNNPATSAVCNILAETLVDMKLPDWLVVRDGGVWVHAPTLSKHMRINNPVDKFTDREISGAVTSVSSKTKSKPMRATKKQLRMWSFRLDALKAWCDNTDVYDWEDVQAGIDKLNKDDAKLTTVPISHTPAVH